MDRITVSARAKINIGLDVLHKRADGYHEIRSVMQSAELADRITVRKGAFIGGLSSPVLTTDCGRLPTDGRNLAVKAAVVLVQKYGIQDGVFIDLQKRIPLCAGLGGGSADSAAVLAGMRDLWGLNISPSELAEIGLSLGADVPFCLKTGTQLAEGIGERLTSLAPLPCAWLLLAKPPALVSSAEVFQAYNLSNPYRPDMEKLLYYIERGDLRGICANMKNALESVTARTVPVIEPLKELMLSCGAFGASMSGSGPTVFGVFDTKAMAERAEAAVKAAMPDINEIIVTRFFDV